MPPKRQASLRGEGKSTRERSRSTLSRTSTESHHKDATHGHKNTKGKDRKSGKRTDITETDAKTDTDPHIVAEAEQVDYPHEAPGSDNNSLTASMHHDGHLSDEKMGSGTTSDNKETDEACERWANVHEEPNDADVESNHGDNKGDDDWEIKSISPDDFDSKYFSSMVGGFSQEFQNANFDDIDSELEAEKIRRLIHNVSVTLNNFKNYSLHSQAQLHGLREEIRQAKSKLNSSIKKRGYDLKTGMHTVNIL